MVRFLCAVRCVPPTATTGLQFLTVMASDGDGLIFVGNLPQTSIDAVQRLFEDVGVNPTEVRTCFLAPLPTTRHLLLLTTCPDGQWARTPRFKTLF